METVELDDSVYKYLDSLVVCKNQISLLNELKIIYKGNEDEILNYFAEWYVLENNPNAPIYLKKFCRNNNVILDNVLYTLMQITTSDSTEIYDRDSSGDLSQECNYFISVLKHFMKLSDNDVRVLHTWFTSDLLYYTCSILSNMIDLLEHSNFLKEFCLKYIDVITYFATKNEIDSETKKCIVDNLQLAISAYVGKEVLPTEIHGLLNIIKGIQKETYGYVFDEEYPSDSITLPDIHELLSKI